MSAGRWIKSEANTLLWLYPSGTLAAWRGGPFRGRIPTNPEMKMNTQDTFFNLLVGEEAAAPPAPRAPAPQSVRRRRAEPVPTMHEVREAAIAQVEEHATEEEVQRVLRAIQAAAREQAELTTDDVRPFIHGEVREPRLLGAMMLRARAAGWIERTDRYAESKHVQSHGRPKRVWRSLVRR